MKIRILVLALFVCLASQSFALNLTPQYGLNVKIENVQIINNELHFDIYAMNLTEELKYLWGGDYFFRINNSAFSNPETSMNVPSGTNLELYYKYQTKMVASLAGEELVGVTLNVMSEYMYTLHGMQGTEQEIMEEAAEKMYPLTHLSQYVQIAHVSISGVIDPLNATDVEWVNDNSLRPRDFSTFIGFLGLDQRQKYGPSRFEVFVGDEPTEGIIATDVEEENEKTGEIRVYPNPASRDIFLDLSEEKGRATVQVYSIEGELVFEGEKVFYNGSLRLSINTFSAGNYFIKAISETGEFLGSKPFTVYK